MHDKAVIRDNKVDGLLTIQVIEGKLRITRIDGDFELNEKQLPDCCQLILQLLCSEDVWMKRRGN